MYNPLPLYHSSAGILCCGPSFYVGLTIALRKKFSAKEYWKDCVKYKATVSTTLFCNFIYKEVSKIIKLLNTLKLINRNDFFQAGQYIGEICRYLLNTPKCPEEERHNIRLMFGNGKRI